MSCAQHFSVLTNVLRGTVSSFLLLKLRGIIENVVFIMLRVLKSKGADSVSASRNSEASKPGNYL